jgi:two-component system nitrogen regulation sensor histidine kinase NtrY
VSDPVERTVDVRPHERSILTLALLAGAPAVAATLILLWSSDHSLRLRWTVGIVVAAWWLVLAVVLRERVVRPLQTLSNMLAALREGDYSIRARGADREDALGLAFLESNLLGETLRAQRLGAMEATALLRTVMAEIDVAIMAFDEEGRVRLANRATERLLDRRAEQLLARTAGEVGLEWLLIGESPRTIDASFAGVSGRWEVRRGAFRQDGRAHMLLVLTDVGKALREEELQAWRRLVRVLSHEINNSLAPIRSIAGTLQGLLGTDAARSTDADDDLRKGLTVIAGRSEALVRFMSSYARLARLPAPQRTPVDVEAWVRRVAALDTRAPVEVENGPSVEIRADGDQLDQVLINLVRNGVDAALETGGGVRIRWRRVADDLTVQVEDDGPGVPDSANLFGPFFTTKTNGSGIGLVLSRQIVEAHGGTLTLESRTDAHGGLATVRLPTS